MQPEDVAAVAINALMLPRTDGYQYASIVEVLLGKILGKTRKSVKLLA